MAQSMNLFNNINKLRYTAVALAMSVLADVAMAQSLQDPTRPPQLVMPESATEQTLAGPVLQSILIAPQRRVAIISGQAVELNGKYGELTLIRMSETEVVLRNPQNPKETQTLKLFPGVDKRMSSPTPNVRTITPANKGKTHE
jgi:MSHA biogenesis protein MshK